jgi:hypothetical protein
MLSPPLLWSLTGREYKGSLLRVPWYLGMESVLISLNESLEFIFLFPNSASILAATKSSSSRLASHVIIPRGVLSASVSKRDWEFEFEWEEDTENVEALGRLDRLVRGKGSTASVYPAAPVKAGCTMLSSFVYGCEYASDRALWAATAAVAMTLNVSSKTDESASLSEMLRLLLSVLVTVRLSSLAVGECDLTEGKDGMEIEKGAWF